MMIPKAVVEWIREFSLRSEEERVEIYNDISDALSFMIRDITTDPACSPKLIRADDITPNDYNPNVVASTEMNLLENSMRADGITMPIVVVGDDDGYAVVDGFHRRTVAIERLGRKYIPCSVISSPMVDRMASTIRHNRARGKHQVELMSVLVKQMMELGWGDEDIAENLGMSVEELLRLRQMAGAAMFLAGDEYSISYGRDDEPQNTSNK